MTTPPEPIDPTRLATAIVIGTLFLAVPFSIIGMAAAYGYPGWAEIGVNTGIKSVSYALIVTALAMPFAMHRLRDPALRPLRWAYAGLIAGVAGSGLQSTLMVFGYFGWMPDMAPLIGIAMGVGAGSGLVAALAAWVVLKLWSQR
ncbi:hypothetical protein P1X14_16515 [Sphingomonas sp. AOB5]|uniref:hypothetical protein n=1 Tax=Sphingomonas sp. AOB5 TaxID=3034017 RepID=UPI0023F7AFAD|nr:hypothetical protein [Sphingomonas sp. AOB5]MDF7776862.1 hypothetical protein [Sphingomonas sp. AOB5]